MHATVGAKAFAYQFNYATTYTEDFAIQPTLAVGCGRRLTLLGNV